MAFTDYFKSVSRFGMAYLGTGSKYNAVPHTDFCYLADSSSKAYYNKDIVIGLGSMSLNLETVAYSPKGWRGFKTFVNESDSDVHGEIATTFNTSSIDEFGNVKIQIILTNSSAESIECRSIAFCPTIIGWSSASSTSSPSSQGSSVVLFENLSTPIVIPANDAVIVDITLSSGDISDVSAG